jgi:hypothetical protein
MPTGLDDDRPFCLLGSTRNDEGPLPGDGLAQALAPEIQMKRDARLTQRRPQDTPQAYRKQGANQQEGETLNHFSLP